MCTTAPTNGSGIAGTGAEIDRVICTLGIGTHASLLEVTAPTLGHYALRHGYDVVSRGAVAGLDDRPPAWGKLLLVQELLESYATVVWIDADAVIVDPREDISVVAPNRPISVVTHVVDGVPVPNTGVMVIRRSRQASELLGRLWNRSDLVTHRWWENAALLAELGGDPDVGLVTPSSRRRFRRLVGELPLRWNSIPTCRHPQPAVVHLAGVPDARRLDVLRALVASSGPAGQGAGELVERRVGRGA